MRWAAWLLVLAGALPAAAQKTDPRQAILSELWQRRVLAPDKREWSAADLILLQRMRRAEDEDAGGFLKTKVHGLRGLAVFIRDPKTRETHLRLTKGGFDKYLFLRSQDALAYFQAHDVGYKWAFLLKDTQDQALFDQSGLLTDAGQTVYDRLLANLEVHYLKPDGQIGGNRAPPKPSEPPPEPVVAQPPRRHYPITQPPPEAQPQPAGPAQQPPPQESQPQAQEPQPPAQEPPPQAQQPGAQGQYGPTQDSRPPDAAQPASAPEPGPAPQDSE